MRMVRRLGKSIATVLLLVVWATTSVGAAVADAVVAGPDVAVSHVEAPDASTHGAVHSHDCAFCQALQWTGVVSPSIEAPQAPAAEVAGVPTRPSSRDAVDASIAGARAPPASHA